MDDLTKLNRVKSRPDMKLRSGRNIPRAGSVATDETFEKHQQEDAESWKALFFRLLEAPSLIMFNELGWSSWWEYSFDTLKVKAYNLIDYMKSLRAVLALISAWAVIGSILHMPHPLNRIKLFINIVIGLTVLSSIVYSIYLVRFPNSIANGHQTMSATRPKQYTSFANHLLDIDSKVTEQTLRLDQFFQKSQYSNKMILEKMSFLSSQIREQQSQLNYQREDYRRIWDALYTQNQYMLSVSDDIKLDVIEALQDNTVAVFDRKNEELKISPEFLEYMQTADFIHAFIQHNKETLQSFIQEELRHFFLTKKDETDTIMERIDQVPSSLEHLVEATVKKYHPEDDDPDFALRSRGGRIILSRTSKSYRPPTTSKSLLRRALGYYPRLKSPWAVIHPSTEVGECWSMNGSNGTIGISLSAEIFMENVTLEHPSANVLLDDIINAPRVFRVFALTTDPFYLQEELVCLGEYQYDIHSQNKTQKFSLLKDRDRSYDTVIIQFVSNWGNPKFTDIYRIKISGNPVSKHTHVE